MKRIPKTFFVFLLILSAAFFICGCSGDKSTGKDSTPRVTLHEFLIPEAAQTVSYGNDRTSIDASNSKEGYIMIKYTGSCSKAKVQITDPKSNTYTYTLSSPSYEAFPLSGGNGSYHIDILENASADLYALVFSQDIKVTLTDEFKPFLYPNQYSWFTPDSQTTSLGIKLSDESYSDLDYVNNVYTYVIETIKYDEQLAKSIPVDYIPDIDTTLSKKSGICFDYAALMTALLRSQGIPAKLEVGYSGTAYHAWISVYLKESGWVDDIIEFDGQSWSLMDPTLASNNSSSSVEKYIGDGSNYIVKYSY